jgi:cytochrome c-type biogenesis protein CcmH
MPSLKVFGMAAGIIVLGGLASYFGLAHGCSKQPTPGIIAGTISVDPGLADKVNPSATLFIVARQADVPFGPPLAVQKIQSPEFPFSYTLSGEDVMRPGTPFQGKITVKARLDGDGTVGTQPGDLEGQYGKNPATVGQDEAVDIIFDKLH